MATASNLDDLLQCPICLDILQDPKVLDCQHTFCANCLKVHHESSARRPGGRPNVIVCMFSYNILNEYVFYVFIK